ncbi:hypothetical protein HMPREF3034_01163 [Prevotella sp. DNF00663]|nr:hypothetical protein HMPREF3034_01163 [Prevotella sp. DNF00663]
MLIPKKRIIHGIKKVMNHIDIPHHKWQLSKRRNRNVSFVF